MKIKKILFLTVLFVILITGCGKKDPILPGTRVSIFSAGEIVINDTEIPAVKLDKMSEDDNKTLNSSAGYEQTHDNIIWKLGKDGNRRKIFSGFPTNSHISGIRTPVVSGEFVYAGLSTGEVVKVNVATREVAWIADVYLATNMTGGASMLDIVAPLVPDGGRFIYAGGLGGQICKLRMTTGAKVWCDNISVGIPFVLSGGVLFVVSADNYLYAIDADSGDIYWRKKIESQTAPKIIKKDSKTIVRVGTKLFEL